jgi:hypothetical protein
MKNMIAAWNKLTEKYPLLVFYLLIIAVCGCYYYSYILFSPPQSIHRWRQTDSASITLNLYQHGMKFFHTEVHSLTSDGDTTGYAVAEAPLLYYLVALLYQLFGPHDYIYRFVNMIIFLIGLGALFQISRHFLKDFVIAAFVPFLVFVSPVAAYYGNSFLTDSTALALVFTGWWQYIRNLKYRHYRIFLYSIILFSLAGLLKATMTLNLVALTGLAVLWHIKWLQKDENKLFPKPFAAYFPVFLGLIIIVSWYLYAIRYNQLHQSSVFLTGITPWWKIAPEERQVITRHIITTNLTQYYSSGIWYFLIACTLLVIFFFKHIPRYITILTLLLLGGGIIYVNLYYTQFQWHDYYFMLLFSPVAFLVLSALMIVRNKFPGFHHSWMFKTVLVVFLLANVLHSREEMKLRYFGWKREPPVFIDLFTIRPYLRSIGMKPSDRIISMPDYTNCYTLYMMNQPGNILGDINQGTKDRIRYFISKGARYLVIQDSAFVKAPEIQEFIRNKTGQYHQVQIFRLDLPDPSGTDYSR